MPQPWRTVRVFISSTFRDMHAERDYLVKVVFPELRERMAKRNLYLVDVDLRWGVTEEEAEHDKVLEVCLDEIERCRPFFIGILGERYGFIPPKLPKDSEFSHPWLVEYTGHSLTALEIIHGVLRSPELAQRAFFYFRDSHFISQVPESQRADFTAESPEAAAKLAALKDKIRTSRRPVMENYPCRWDDTPRHIIELEAFGRQVLEDLWAAICAAYPEEAPEADPLTIERQIHEAFAEEHSRLHVGREEQAKRLTEYIQGKDRRPVVITGESGCGKSAFLAKWYREYVDKHPDDFVLAYFIGASPDSTNHFRLLHNMCQELMRRFSLKEEIPDPNLRAAIREAIGQPTGDIYSSSLASLNQLFADGRGIVNLAGLEHCTGMQLLVLDQNLIADITPLASLAALQRVFLDSNNISDITPLSGLTHLLDISLRNNQVSDITPLQNLSRLRWLRLQNNQVCDIQCLTACPGLQPNDNVSEYVELQKNPLSFISVTDYIPQLLANGVDVRFDRTITATGTGMVILEPGLGTIGNVAGVDESELPAEGKPDLEFPHGFFDFEVEELTPGATITLDITLPLPVPIGTQYWKYGPTPSNHTDHWYQIPMGDDDGDNLVIITLVDGGLGDDDLTANAIIVDQGGPGFLSTIDTTPPAAVSDLRVSQTYSTMITIAWTAPGDDGNVGTASQYDVRYSTSAITEANWDSATQCTGEPSPKPAGSAENFTVPGFRSGTTYYFALKTADEVPTWSSLSNVVSATTMYALNISSTAGGTVTTPGVGIFTRDAGTVVNLVATPNAGYRFVKWAGNVSTIANVNAATTTITMQDDYNITANFEEVPPLPRGCFIATAAYGTPMAEEIQILREFRDEYLLTNPVGQALVDFYYKVSPPIAEFITEHPALKPIVRVGLAPAVALSMVAVNTTPAEKIAIVGLAVLVSMALAVWAKRRRGRGTEYT